MQLLSDGISVLGSRHGLLWEPGKRQTYLMRSGQFPGVACEFKAGIRVGDRVLTLPLTSEGEDFTFYDQDSDICNIKLTGIDAASGIKLELDITTPFRPRDAEFSTIPVLDIKLTASMLDDPFRWFPVETIEGNCQIFIEIASNAFTNIKHDATMVSWQMQSDCFASREATESTWQATQYDALVAHTGKVQNSQIVMDFVPSDKIVRTLHCSWCSYSMPMLTVHDKPAPFKYTEKFNALEDVVQWTLENPSAITANATIVNKIFAQNNLGIATNSLLANTLHSYLACTWWTLTPEREIFSVWEGSCYYHSTIDVEYTQTPFYLTVWPELLGLELDYWTEFTVPGEEVIGERGVGTRVFMHDIGQMSQIDTTRYNHHMPVEENCNYVLMSFAYWRRTGDDQYIKRHAAVIAAAINFLLAADSTGNGVPNMGMSNTIDDASPAVQFGKEQLYLAVKSLATYEAGIDIFEYLKLTAPITQWRTTADMISDEIKNKGWQDDHFVTLLNKSTDGLINSWSGEKFSYTEFPGWDAAHIYTANGLALFDMIGKKINIDEERLKTDLKVATQLCMTKYGCRHSSFDINEMEETAGEGGVTGNTTRRGWVSMNMLRDISALYRKVDLRAMNERYWQFQQLCNSQGAHMFFETFNGNNLYYYPRGIVIFGLFDAVGGVEIDQVIEKQTINPYDDQIKVPLLLSADWHRGTVEVIEAGKLKTINLNNR
jgi:xylan 1,4-beta-xylosidase